MTTTVGVLALQGAYREHIEMFKRVAPPAFEFIEVRTEPQLAACDALVIPGGESTAIALIALRTNLLEPLMAFVRSEKPVWGTCAGLIFLARQIINGQAGQQILGGLDVVVRRNAFGRQLDSFEQRLDFSRFIPGVTDFPTVFIRAPVVDSVLADHVMQPGLVQSQNSYQNPAAVEVLHRLELGLIVAVRQGTKLGTLFHPELLDDARFHRWFLEEFVQNRQ